MNAARAAKEEKARRILEAQKAHALRQGAVNKRLATLSPAQLRLRLDKSPMVVTVSGRQAGKTEDIVSTAMDLVGDNPSSIVYGVLPTRERARDTIWDRWKQSVVPLGCTDDHHNETRLETRIPGGGIFRLIGAPDLKRADRVRGQVLNGLLIDEASNFPDNVLKHLVQDSGDAALAIKKGVMRIYATPGSVPEGFLHRLYTDKSMDISRHFITIFDNPAMVDPAEYLAKLRTRYGYTEDDPTYQREWLGRWIADHRARVYRISDENLIDDPGKWDYTVMALDLGATDESAICVLGWQAGSRVLKVLHEEAAGELDITSVAERVKALQEQYQPMVTMVDGAAKQSVLELQNRHGIPLEATPKAPNYKGKAIAQVNADLKRGLVQIPRTSELVSQMRALQWDPKAVGMREKPGQPNDRCFVAGTMVATSAGDIPIELVNTSMLMSTRHGFFHVLRAGPTGAHDTITVETAGGRKITGTAAHPVLTQSGWRQLMSLVAEDILYSCQSQETDIFKGGSDTGRHGNEPTARSPRGASFTTRTEILETTASRIWSAFRTKSTPITISKILDVERILAELSSKLSPRHRSGTDRQRDEHGTLNMHERSGLIANPQIAYALCVEPCFRREQAMLPFAQTIASPSNDARAASMMSDASASSAERATCETSMPSLVVAPDRVVSVTASGKQLVYNLTVDTAHEYFANGILVSNCDAFLYAYLKAYHYVEHEPEQAIVEGSPEYWEQERQKVRAEHERASQARDVMDPWANIDTGGDPWHT